MATGANIGLTKMAETDFIVSAGKDKMLV